MKRRLSAVLAADVVGYSTLMASDEAGTLAALRAHRREVFEPEIAKREGRIVKLIGDGALVEFSSVVDAVECAVAIQSLLAGDDGKIQLRIGINLGDVVIDGDDIYGDGVNVATRLEGLAEIGGICVSSIVHESIGNRVAADFTDAGEHLVKGIPRPIRVWRWASHGDVRPAATIGSVTSAPPEKLSIAVLPFTGSTAESESSSVADGIAEDIAIELSRFHQLAVLSAGSSNRLAMAQDPIAEARSAGAHYLVDGKIRWNSDPVRLAIRLVQVESGNQVWAERFDSEKQNIFSVQDEIVTRIVGSVAERIQAAGADRARKKLPANLAAYECVLRARSLAIGNPESEAEARRLYERAIELDPEYALAFARLAHMLTLEWDRDLSSRDYLLDRALDAAKKAVSLDANDPACQQWLGWVYLFRQEFNLAQEHFTRAIELNPNDVDNTARMGMVKSYLGKSDEALAWLDRAREIDRYFEPAWFWHARGVAYFTAERFVESINAFEHSSTMPLWVKAYVATAHALAGNFEAAEKYRSDILRALPEFSPIRFVKKEPLQRDVDRNRLLSGMQLSGFPKEIPDHP